MLEGLKALKTFILPGLKYLNIAVGSSANIRSGFVFNDDHEFKMANPEEIKAHYDGGDDSKKNAVISNAELHIKGLNKKLPGLGTVVDVVFSANTLKVLTLLGAGALIFSPLGPYVAAAGIALTVGVLAVNTALEIRAYKNRQNEQIKNSLLKESVKEHDKLYLKTVDKTIFPKQPDLANELLKVTKNFGQQKLFDNQDKVNSKQPIKSSLITATGWALGTRMPTAVFSLTVAIITLNPISISISALSFALGAASGVAQSKKGMDAEDAFANRMLNMRQKLGEPDKSIEEQTKDLAELKRVNRAMDHFARDYDSNLTKLKNAGIEASNSNMAKLFETEYLDKEPVVALNTPKIGYGTAAKGVLLNFTWSGDKTAMCPENPKYAGHFSNKAYETACTESLHKDSTPSRSHEPDVDRFIRKITNPGLEESTIDGPGLSQNIKPSLLRADDQKNFDAAAHELYEATHDFKVKQTATSHQSAVESHSNIPIDHHSGRGA